MNQDEPCWNQWLAEELSLHEANAVRAEELRSYRKSLESEPAKQRALLTGLDCLEGQEELFQTDGQE